MPKISLTDFVDIVSKSGTPKANKVAQVKNRPDYDPSQDFYKMIRECIIQTHQKNGDKTELRRMLIALSDPKKRANYPEIVAGYSKWWGRKTLKWFSPPADVFVAHGIEVSVNPELGLVVNGQKHIIKLYFKGEKLSKNKIDIATHLMEACLRPKTKLGDTMSVLDIRNSRLISPTVPVAALSGALNAELAYIAALWPGV